MQKYKVFIPSSVVLDIQEIVDYISEDNPSVALAILQKLEKKINTLKEFPERGRVVPELLDQNITEYHELIESPWRIIYKVVDSSVFLLTVIDSRRNVQDILLRKLMNRGK
jgi:plasmid stabilization system protein ParE